MIIIIPTDSPIWQLWKSKNLHYFADLFPSIFQFLPLFLHKQQQETFFLKKYFLAAYLLWWEEPSNVRNCAADNPQSARVISDKKLYKHCSRWEQWIRNFFDYCHMTRNGEMGVFPRKENCWALPRHKTINVVSWAFLCWQEISYFCKFLYDSLHGRIKTISKI